MKLNKIVAILIIGFSSFSMISIFAEDSMNIGKANGINKNEIPLLNQLPNDELETTEDNFLSEEFTEEQDSTEKIPEEPVEEMPIQPLYENIEQLESHEIIVKTYAELKSAIENSENGLTTIYLGADIAFGNSGMIVSPAKNSFIIDGTNPLTGIRHRIDEYNASGITNAIYVLSNTNGNSQIELRNVDINGQNAYGTVAVADATANMRVKYSNVSYNGPRLIYNGAGTLILNNSNIKINPSGYFSTPQEVGQINKVQFEGDVLISHSNWSTKGLFYFRNNNRLSTVKEGANVVIDTDRFYDNTPENLAGFVMEPNSTFKMVAKSGGYPIFKAKTFQLDNSEFDLTINGTQSNYLFRIDGDASSGLTMKNNSTLNITTNASSATVAAGVYQRGNWNVNNSTINYKATNAVANYIFNMDNPIIKDSEFNIVTDGTINNAATGSHLEASTLTLDNSLLNISANVNSGKLLSTTTGESLKLLNAPKINLYSKKLEGVNGLVNNSGALSIPSNGEFKAIVENSAIGNTNSFIKIVNKLQVEENASFQVAGNSGTHSALVQITGATPQLLVNNPKLFVLFTKNATTGAFVMSNPLNFTLKGQQINQWTTAPLAFENSGGFDHLPIYEYKKASGVDYEISGRLTTTGSTLVTSTNYALGDGFYPGDYFDFGVGRTRMLSIGHLDGDVSPVTVGDTRISGTTSANANIKFTYKQKDSGLEEIATGVASESGEYSINTNPISEETYLLQFNTPFLYKSIKGIPEQFVGELIFVTVPSTMPFGKVPIQTKTTIFDRIDNSWDIVIKDNRDVQPRWKLFVAVTKNLTPVDTSKPRIDNAFVYVSDDGTSTPLYLNVPQEVAVSSTSETEIISWSKDRGVLLKINPGSVFKDIEYSGILQWTLADAP